MSSDTSDLELSYSSSDFDETEDIGIRPFLYEPEVSESDDNDSSAHSSEEDEETSTRLGNTDW